MDQLKSEIKDKERQCHTIETREAYARQELTLKVKDLQQKHEDQKEANQMQEREMKQMRENLQGVKDKLQKTEVKV